MKPPIGHSLKVKCPTWDHVESFYGRKVKEGNTLTARVPFHPSPGDVITLALELPDELVIAIEAEVEEATPAPDGKKSAVRLRVFGMTASVRARLESLVDEARRQRSVSTPGRARRESTAPPAGSSGFDDIEPSLPPPLPIDAPVDERVEPYDIPAASDVPERVRPVFDELLVELGQLREAAAHDVLGVAWDADVEAIRQAYFGLTKRVHPDVFARHRSIAIQILASELFIHVNRAYDRMRDAAVASGAAIAPGPALLAHRGWMAGFEDFGGGGGPRNPTPARGIPAMPLTAPSRPPPVPPRRAGEPRQTPVPVPLTSEGLFGDMATPSPEAIDQAESPEPADVRATGQLAVDLLPETTKRMTTMIMTASDLTAGEVPDGPSGADVMVEARQLIARIDYARAREILAAALRREPRNRAVRSLYHLASAEALLADGKAVEATTQLEVALAHDPTLEEAKAMHARLRQDGARKGNLFRRLFR